jgi:hypothetical protein
MDLSPGVPSACQTAACDGLRKQPKKKPQLTFPFLLLIW